MSCIAHSHLKKPWVYDDLYDYSTKCATSFSTDGSVTEKLLQLKQTEISNDDFLRLKIRRKNIWEDTKFKFTSNVRRNGAGYGPGYFWKWRWVFLEMVLGMTLNCILSGAPTWLLVVSVLPCHLQPGPLQKA